MTILFSFSFPYRMIRARTYVRVCVLRACVIYLPWEPSSGRRLETIYVRTAVKRDDFIHISPVLLLSLFVCLSVCLSAHTGCTSLCLARCSNAFFVPMHTRARARTFCPGEKEVEFTLDASHMHTYVRTYYLFLKYIFAWPVRYMHAYGWMDGCLSLLSFFSFTRYVFL